MKVKNMAKIIVAVANMSVRGALTLRLTHEGHEVIEASDENKATGLVHTVEHDIIVASLEQSQQRMETFYLGLVRRDHGGKPVIFFTEDRPPSSIAAEVSYVAKPDVRDLVARVEELLIGPA